MAANRTVSLSLEYEYAARSIHPTMMCVQCILLPLLFVCEHVWLRWSRCHQHRNKYNTHPAVELRLQRLEYKKCIIPSYPFLFSLINTMFMNMPDSFSPDGDCMLAHDNDMMHPFNISRIESRMQPTHCTCKCIEKKLHLLCLLSLLFAQILYR